MIVGGLRARLLQDSVHAVLIDGLTEAGWLDPGRNHLPVQIQPKPAKWTSPIQPNLVAIDFLSVDTEEAELGSPLTADMILAYIEVYAESDSLGVGLSNDIRDLLRGRLSVARAGGTLPILDFRHATPPVIGYLRVDRVSALRNASPTEDVWVRHWYRVRCEFTDTYYTSEA